MRRTSVRVVLGGLAAALLVMGVLAGAVATAATVTTSCRTATGVRPAAAPNCPER